LRIEFASHRFLVCRSSHGLLDIPYHSDQPIQSVHLQFSIISHSTLNLSRMGDMDCPISFQYGHL
jgi:hypothetical protein